MPEGSDPIRTQARRIDDAANTKMGDEIRQLRQAKGFTLRDLARLSGRSLGYLSQIERGSVQPSLATLKNIADALGVEVNWFFPSEAGIDNRERGVVVRSQSRRRLSHAYSFDTEALGYEDFLLSGNLDQDHVMGLSRVSPNGVTNEAKRSYEGCMSGYVVQGSLVLELDDDTFVLFEGDSFSFDTARPHLLRNETDAIAAIVWCVTPVRLTF